MTATAVEPERGTAPRNRSRWLLPLAAIVTIAMGAAVTAEVTGDHEPTSTAQLSHIQASCGDWMRSSQADTPPDDHWCTEMFAWMSDQSGGTMMGSMMWQGAQQMGTACRTWVSQDRAEMGASGPRRCNDMVAWMNEHMSSRNGNWMMQNG